MAGNLSRRQEDVILNIFFKVPEIFTERDRKSGGEPWGECARFWSKRTMGGALNRMRQTLEDGGWLARKPRLNGVGSYATTEYLPLKSIRYLKEKFPNLPGVDAALSEALSREAREEVARQAEREIAAKREAERDAERSKKRREAMAEILMRFQIQHSLSPDQLETLMTETAEAEMST